MKFTLFSAPKVLWASGPMTIPRSSTRVRKIGPVRIFWTIWLITIGRYQIIREGATAWRWIHDEEHNGWLGTWRGIALGLWRVRWTVASPAGHYRVVAVR